MKGNIKTPRHWPLWGKPPTTGGFPSQRTSNLVTRKMVQFDDVIMIAPVPLKQPWVWVNESHINPPITADIPTTKQSTTSCAYAMGCTVYFCVSVYLNMNDSQFITGDRPSPKLCGWLPIRNWRHTHDDVIKWKQFPCYWPFVRGIHRSPVNSPHKGQWGGTLMFSLICAWINSRVNNREAGDLRWNRAHYDVRVMGWAAFTCSLGWLLSSNRGW